MNNLQAEEKKVCGQNYYCPISTNARITCAVGTYTTKVTANSQDDCMTCPAGFICKCTDASAITDTCVAEFVECPEGYYCPSGTYQDSDKQDCGAGYYCPLATPFRVPCDAGHYCDLTTMAALDTAKICDGGYVCLSAASTATPLDGTTGYQCPAGAFCLPGSAAEEPCLIGSYRDSPGATQATDCTECSADEQCNARGLKAIEGTEIICAAGNYCPKSDERNPCDPGYYCPQNVKA